MGRDLFPVTLFGQTVVAMSQVFVLGVPPNVAAVWFGADQVSSACSIGVFGNQVSCPNVNLYRAVGDLAQQLEKQ